MAITRRGLREFIFSALDYDPPDRWRPFHDRVSLLRGAAPSGYFIVFSEMSGMTVDLISAGLPVDDRTVPDISVGNCWGRFWREGEFDEHFGERVKYPHMYPSYFRQAKSNPQEAWAYPGEALPGFRDWLEVVYLPHYYPAYIQTKAKELEGGREEAARIAGLYAARQIQAA